MTLEPWPSSGLLFINHLSVHPLTLRCSSQLKSPISITQSDGFSFSQFDIKFSSFDRTSSTHGEVVLYLWGTYAQTTKSGQTGPSSLTQTILGPTEPLVRIFEVKSFSFSSWVIIQYFYTGSLSWKEKLTSRTPPSRARWVSSPAVMSSSSSPFLKLKKNLRFENTNSHKTSRSQNGTLSIGSCD